MIRQTALLHCSACKDGTEPPFPFTMAFQPIVDVEAGYVFAYEALVRGPQGESAADVLGKITDANRYAFDQNCRVKAISMASQLELTATNAMLSINFMPGAIYSPSACIQLTLKTAQKFNFPLDRLIFEITEAEEVVDPQHLLNIAKEYRRYGFRMALDDFGAGYCGLNLLANLPTDIIKLDMGLTRNLHQRPAALAIVKAMAGLAKTLGHKLIAEGVETIEEYAAIRACGLHLLQGYLLARPGFETLPAFTLPEDVSQHVARIDSATMRTAGVLAIPHPGRLSDHS
jgi:EAL domain-containing protein (putative c-di-GMP-specific phosphodiesterase class I)